MTPQDPRKWLEDHISHRIRACLTVMLPELLGSRPEFWVDTLEQRKARRCLNQAIYEGRLVAMRWLIELVGVARDSKTNKPCRPRKYAKTDASIADIDPNALFDLNSPDAQKLADVWKGTTQASSHRRMRASIPT